MKIGLKLQSGERTIKYKRKGVKGIMKILVSDFDNTLFTEDYHLNIKEINKFVKKGNMFIIATGRNYNQLMKEIKSKKIKYNYLICNDGGLIFDKNHRLIYRLDIDHQVVDDLILEFAMDPNIQFTLIDDGFQYYENKTNLNNALIARYNNYDLAQQKIKELMKKYPVIFGYLSRNWINIVNKEASKGKAIKYLVNQLNLKEEAVYTIGDSTNDISMNKLFNGYFIKNNSKPQLMEISKGSVNSVWELVKIIEEAL